MNIVKPLFVVLLSYACAFGLQAEMYEWTDEKGVKHFSNVAPSESVEAIKTEKEDKAGTAIDAKQRIDVNRSTREAGRPPRKVAETATTTPEDKSPPGAAEENPEMDFAVRMNLNLQRFPMSQDDLINEEIARLREIKNHAEITGLNNEDLIAGEKNRLQKAIGDLERAALDKFGSSDNKSRQVGFYKYRLDELLESPERYFSYSGD